MRKILFILVCLTCFSCNFDEIDKAAELQKIKYVKDRLPIGSTNIQDRGNEWTSFDFEGNHYLVYVSGHKFGITQVK
jgi:hypothetical protein